MKLFRELTSDHDKITDLIKEIEAYPTRAETLFSELAVLIICHQAAEQEMTRICQEMSPKLASRILAEHDNIQRMLQVILDVGFRGEHWMSQFDLIKGLLKRHIKFEQRELYRCLEKQTPNEQARMLKEYEETIYEIEPIAREMLRFKLLVQSDQMVPLNSDGSHHKW